MLRAVDEVFVDFLVLAVSAGDSVLGDLVALVESEVVLAFFGVGLFEVEKGCLVGFTLCIGVVHVSEEVEVVGQLCSDVL